MLKTFEQFEDDPFGEDVISNLCSIDDIKKWVDENIEYYEECENVDNAIDDMLHDFKTHFLNINLDETFKNEKELIKYFKSEWKQY